MGISHRTSFSYLAAHDDLFRHVTILRHLPIVIVIHPQGFSLFTSSSSLTIPNNCAARSMSNLLECSLPFDVGSIVKKKVEVRL
jgi:hypothetical protein